MLDVHHSAAIYLYIPVNPAREFVSTGNQSSLLSKSLISVDFLRQVVQDLKESYTTGPQPAEHLIVFRGNQLDQFVLIVQKLIDRGIMTSLDSQIAILRYS
jgi:hypothetical protein